MQSRGLALSAVVAGGLLFVAVALWPAPRQLFLSSFAEVVAQSSTEAPVRDVTPVWVTPSPPSDGALTRLAAPEPPPKPKKEQPEWRRFFQPVATSAAVFTAGSQEVRIAGIAAPDAETQCPCGIL